MGGSAVASLMKICLISQEYPPETHGGGIGTYTCNMAPALAKLGHQVHVITATRYSEHTSQESGVWVHKIRRRINPLKELQYLGYSCSVAKHIGRLNCAFDIVQSSEFGSEAFCLSLHRTFPLVTRLATPFFLLERLNGRMFLGPRPLFNWMEKTQTLRSDGIFASTKALAKAVSREWNIETPDVEVIPNSVDIARVVRLAQASPPPVLLKNRNFLLYFGRLEERKGVRVLAHALPAVFEQFPELTAVFIGTDQGYHGASMQEYIKNYLGNYQRRIMFMNGLTQEELFPIVALATIVVLPSLWEAFGFVCVEAMALGRPVIATSGSGFDEIIGDKISGYLVDPGNSAALSEKIIRALQDKPRLRVISDEARKRARDFEVSRVALQVLAYFEKIREEWARNQKVRAN
jgi:glycogen(starch) synthase